MEISEVKVRNEFFVSALFLESAITDYLSEKLNIADAIHSELLGNSKKALSFDQKIDALLDSANFSIIDKGLTVDGEVSCNGKLVIKGVVKGILEGEIVIIAKEGAAYADTKVKSMTIGGKFEGKIQASDELIILSTGNCSGKVVCKDLIVEAGGILNAEVSCTKFKEIESPKEVTASVK